MNAMTRNRLIRNLAPIIKIFIDDQDLNTSAADDIGYVSPKTSEYMARAAILILESNSDAQTFAVKDGFLH